VYQNIRFRFLEYRLLPIKYIFLSLVVHPVMYYLSGMAETSPDWRSRVAAAQTFLSTSAHFYSNRTINLTKRSATGEIARDADYVDFSVDDVQGIDISTLLPNRRYRQTV